MTKDKILFYSDLVCFPKNTRCIKFFHEFDDNGNQIDNLIDKINEVRKHFRIIIWDEKWDYHLNQNYVEVYFKI